MNVYYVYLDRVDSTNDWVKRHAQELKRDGVTCVTAEEQTAGRGQFKRTWLSGRGDAVLATLFFILPKASPVLPKLGQIFSASCCTVLESLGFSPTIKPPNDILLDGKKVAGILCEIIDLGEVHGVVLGFGINVSTQEKLLLSIDQPATSLEQASGKNWKRDEILEPLIQQFLRDLQEP